jgi:aminoglycoside 6-adenylyltransferase
MAVTNPFLDKLVEDFVNWAKDIEQCRAICLFGSKARQVHPADEYSDRDMLVYATDADSTRYHDWMRNYAPLWMDIADNPDSNLRLMVFKGGKSVHLAIEEPASLQKQVDTQELSFDLRFAYTILLDKDGVTAKLPAPQLPQFTLPDEAEFRACIENFLYGITLIAKQLKRGNLWTVQWANGFLKQQFILRMIEWHSCIFQTEQIWHRGEFMQEWVRADIWAALDDAFGRFDAADSWRALFGVIALFRKLAQEIASHLHYPYPESLVTEVVAYVEVLHMGEE